MRTTFIAIWIFSFVSISCTEENKVTPFTYSKIFTGETQKVWALSELLVTKIGEDTQSFDLEPCEKDDRYTFKADPDKSLIIDNGNTACPVGEGQDPEPDVYAEVNWSFVNAGAVLTIQIPRIFGDQPIPFIVREVTSSRMVLEIYADFANTISYQVVMVVVEE